MGVAGLLSSSCCLLQLGFNFLSAMDIIHVGCAGFNKVLGPVRSILRGVTGAGLVCLWTVTAWQFLQSSQSNGSKPKSSSRIGRGKFGRLLLQTVITVSLMFMPEVLKHMGGPKVAPPVDQVDTHIVTIDNMGCEACEYTVQGLIDRTDGVVASNLDFGTGIAKIYVAKDWGFDLQKLEDELMYRGYTLLMGTGHETVHMRRMKSIQKKQNKTKKRIKTEGETQGDSQVADAKM